MNKNGIAQRARNKKRVKAIHAKIKQLRHNQLHQESTKLVKTTPRYLLAMLMQKV